MSDAISEAPSIRALGRYELDAEVGHGAHGRVFRGHRSDRPTETRAIKLVESSANLDRLLLEPQLLSQLRHPNIVQLDDYFLSGGRVVLVMEFVGEGMDLERYLKRRGQMSPTEVRDFLVQIGKALEHAHGQSILHGDLKPSNILVDVSAGTPRYVVVDFGVSRVVGRIQTARQLSGTYAFMAPEQMRGRPTMQSDLWALGAIAYLCLAGHRPFEAESLADLSRSVSYEPVPALGPRMIRPDWVLEQVIYKLLDKDPANRIQTASDLFATLGADSTADATNGGTASEIGTTARAQWEESIRLEMKAKKQLFFILAALFALPDIVSGGLALAGIILFASGQDRQDGRRTAWGMALMLASVVVIFTIDARVGPALESDSRVMLETVMNVAHIPLAYFAAKAYLDYRARERDLNLLDAAITSSDDPGLWITRLERAVAIRSGDLNLHQRFADALLSLGRIEEAAVEAKLMLQVDPYDFSATLLLGNAYFELGLLEECRAVATGYLAVAGHCFEFRDLLDRCEREMGGQHALSGAV